MPPFRGDLPTSEKSLKTRFHCTRKVHPTNSTPRAQQPERTLFTQCTSHGPPVRTVSAARNAFSKSAQRRRAGTRAAGSTDAPTPGAAYRVPDTTERCADCSLVSLEFLTPRSRRLAAGEARIGPLGWGPPGRGGRGGRLASHEPRRGPPSINVSTRWGPPRASAKPPPSRPGRRRTKSCPPFCARAGSKTRVSPTPCVRARPDLPSRSPCSPPRRTRPVSRRSAGFGDTAENAISLCSDRAVETKPAPHAWHGRTNTSNEVRDAWTGRTDGRAPPERRSQNRVGGRWRTAGLDAPPLRRAFRLPDASGRRNGCSPDPCESLTARASWSAAGESTPAVAARISDPEL